MIFSSEFLPVDLSTVLLKLSFLNRLNNASHVIVMAMQLASCGPLVFTHASMPTPSCPGPAALVTPKGTMIVSHRSLRSSWDPN